jgi:DNA-binding transcriptional MerR regulator
MSGAFRFILRAREPGFGIEEVRAPLRPVDIEQQTCAEVRKRTELYLANGRRKISGVLSGCSPRQRRDIRARRP